MAERGDGFEKTTTKKKKSTNLNSIFSSPHGDTKEEEEEEEKGSSKTNDHYIQTIASVLCPSPLGVSRESFLKFSDLCPELVRGVRSRSHSNDSSHIHSQSKYCSKQHRYNIFVRVF